MRSFVLLLTASALTLSVFATPQSPHPQRLPLRWGILAYPTFVGLDAFAPIEILNIVRMLTPNMTIAIIAETMDPVPSHALTDIGVPGTYLRPTHTIYDNIPLDVLLVPGGGPESAVQFNNTRLINYVKRTYPSLQHILSTCTGAQFLAKAGILDGKKATTSKFSWKDIIKTGPRVKWACVCVSPDCRAHPCPGSLRSLGQGRKYLDQFWSHFWF